MPSWAWVLVAFVAMEPLTAAGHRWVMHGPGWVWHASHHRRRTGRWERNDRFPLVFAAATIAVMAVGSAVPALEPLLWIGAGVTLYGATYAFVHDLYIHRRWARLTGHVAVLDRLADAHALHHRYNAEPYGMLVPVVSATVRARVARGDRPVPDAVDPVRGVTPMDGRTPAA